MFRMNGGPETQAKPAFEVSLVNAALNALQYAAVAIS